MITVLRKNSLEQVLERSWSIVKRRNIFHTTRVRRSGTEVDGTGGFENIGPIIRVDSPFSHETKQPTLAWPGRQNFHYSAYCPSG